MGRKRTGPKKEENNDDLMDEETFEESESYGKGGLNPTYHEKIIEFLEKCNLQVNDAIFYLYKFESYTTGQDKALIEKVDGGDPPDENEVGMKYGSGRYMIIMYIPEGKNQEQKTRCYKFRIHPYYDKRRSVELGESLVPVPVHDQRKDTSMLDAFAIVNGLLQTMIPLIRPPENPGFEKMMQNNFSLVSDVMKKQMLGSVDLMEQYQRKVAQIKNSGGDVRTNENEEAGDSGVMEVIGQLAPLLEQWLPKMIGGGAQGRVVTNLVKDTAMFREITKNRKMVVGLINYLDNQKGREETDKVLKALNMRRLKVSVPSK